MREGKPWKPAGWTKVTLRSRLAVSRTGCAVSPTKSIPKAHRVRATYSPRKKSKTQDAADGTGWETAEPLPPRMDGAEPTPKGRSSPMRISPAGEAIKWDPRESVSPAAWPQPFDFAGWMVSRFFFCAHFLYIVLIFIHFTPFLYILPHFFGSSARRRTWARSICINVYFGVFLCAYAASMQNGHKPENAYTNSSIHFVHNLFTIYLLTRVRLCVIL